MLFDDTPDDDVFFDDDDAPLGADDVALAEIPSPRATEHLIGHEAIEKQLLEMYAAKRFPHGLVFSGAEGIGKSVMAFRLARFLFAQAEKNNEGPSLFGDAPIAATSLFIPHTDAIFQRVVSGGNPDFLTIGRLVDDKTGRLKGSVGVDEIRKIAPFLRHTSSVENGWRIVIVDDADTMTRSSQNSLLKILEEPPERALLILIAHRAGALLPTVYSRCMHIPFSRLDDAPITAALTGRTDKKGVPQIVALAEGSLGRAYDYALPEHAELIEKSLNVLQKFPAFKWGEIQKFADLFGNKGNDDAQRIFRSAILSLVSRLVRNKLTGFEGLQALSLERRIKLYDLLTAHFDRCAQGNLDKRFLIMGAYMAFEA